MQPQKGDTVQVNYTGRLKDGTVFDTSENKSPLEFKIGTGQVIPGFEEAVCAMEVGARKTVVIPVEKAYGARHEELIMEVGRDQFPPDIKPEVGQQIEMTKPDGQKVIVRVGDLTDSNVTLDANPPLAGQELTFELELVAIV